MNWFGLLYVGFGICLIAGSGKIAQYNRFIRGQEVAKAEKRVSEKRVSKILNQMRLDFYKSSVEAGKIDRVCFILVGIAALVLGIFALYHPNGWN